MLQCCYYIFIYKVLNTPTSLFSPMWDLICCHIFVHLSFHLLLWKPRFCFASVDVIQLFFSLTHVFCLYTLL
jgi:hypothetical protein